MRKAYITEQEGENLDVVFEELNKRKEERRWMCQQRF
jgi:hypothetical protein